MKSETDRLPQTPEDVLNELRTLVGEAEKILGDAPKGSCDCDATLEALRARLEAAQEKFAATYEGAKRKVVAGAKYADDKIRDNPYPSLALALGIGVLAGVLVGRRWNSSSQ